MHDETPLEELFNQDRLDHRVKLMLTRANIQTVGQLTKKDEKDLILIRSFGDACLERVKTRLSTIGRSLTHPRGKPLYPGAGR